MRKIYIGTVNQYWHYFMQINWLSVGRKISIPVHLYYSNYVTVNLTTRRDTNRDTIGTDVISRLKQF